MCRMNIARQMIPKKWCSISKGTKIILLKRGKTRPTRIELNLLQPKSLHNIQGLIIYNGKQVSHTYKGIPCKA